MSELLSWYGTCARGGRGERRGERGEERRKEGGEGRGKEKGGWRWRGEGKGEGRKRGEGEVQQRAKEITNPMQVVSIFSLSPFSKSVLCKLPSSHAFKELLLLGCHKIILSILSLE